MEDADIDELERELFQTLGEESKADEPSSKNSTLRPFDFLSADSEEVNAKDNAESTKSLLVSLGLNDSSDEDEDERMNRRYNEYAQQVKDMLKREEMEKKHNQVDNEVRKSINNSTTKSQSSAPARTTPTFNPVNPTLVAKSVPTSSAISCFTDPIFGMKIIRPLVSSALLKERMSDKKAISSTNIRTYVDQMDKSVDWVIAGAIVSKSPVRTSQNGAQFSIWQISDLRGADVKTVALFLFKGAHKDLWKTAQGMIVAVLNPSVMERRQNSKDEATVCVDTAQKVMVLGQSKDMGYCKSKKKNGDPCGALVNLGTCEYCIFHVKKEFGNLSQRSELQSSTAGRGLNDLRNKVLGKNEVFYGGQSFSAVPAKKNPKLVQKDQDRLMRLSEYYGPTLGSNAANAARPKDTARATIASSVELNSRDRAKDLERLKLLKEYAASQENTKNTLNIAQVKADMLAKTSNVKPRLSQGELTFTFSASPKLAPRPAANKLRAVQALQKNPIVKEDPNLFKYRGTATGKKRLQSALESSEGSSGLDPKRPRMDQPDPAELRKSRIQRIMDAHSSHANLIELKEQEAQQKYFDVLEKKEAMEAKMIGTYKMACKAVACLKCKYMAFKASDLCKTERHPLKLMEAEKRFFKCADCGNRTVSLQRLPKTSCSNCSGSRWERTGMMKEKTVTLDSEKLSIRGDEEMFIGGASSKDMNLNLNVAEE